MIKVAFPAQMRDADRQAIALGISGMVLMERAALAAAQHLRSLHQQGQPIWIFAGSGNNGGDALAMHRMLCQWGLPSTCFLCCDPQKLSGDALAQWQLLSRLGLQVQVLTQPPQTALQHGWIVDGLLGTGAIGTPRGLIAQMIEWINQSGAQVLSVDIPSGLDGLSGAADLAVYADHTITFAAYKTGLLLQQGRGCAGKITVADIGIPHSLLQALPDVITAQNVKKLLPSREPSAYKGDFGHVLVLAGSVTMPGAALLCTQAVVRAGAGLTTLAFPQGAYAALAGKVAEVMAHPLAQQQGCLDGSDPALLPLLKRASVVAMGPGWGRQPCVAQAIRAAGECDLKAVLDADALYFIAQEPSLLRLFEGRAVLTPHVGEMARLMGLENRQVMAQPVKTALDAAQRFGVVVVMKGATSVIAAPDGAHTFNVTGTPAMAKGGSGDALTGIIAALLAQGLCPYDAARLGCYLHGSAGQRAAQSSGQYGLLASDLINALPAVMGDVGTGF